MTTISTGVPDGHGLARLRWRVGDVLTIGYRNLLQLKHAPGQIIGTLVFPLAAVVLFGYVFGSAIPVGDGGNYRAYLMPGLFVMSTVTTLVTAMITIASDSDRGVMDRFRSMPASRSSILLGQTGADLLVNAVTLLVMAGAGLLVGWRVQTGPGPALGAFGLLMLLQFAVSWVGIFLGTVFRNVQTAAKLGPLVMPVTMISNVFVPTSGMPTVLRTVADWNPVSAAAGACRQLFGNQSATVSPVDPAWPVAHPVAATIGWSVLLVVVFMPLAIRRFDSGPH
ncbi:ABC transporter permease [Micromonospora sp. NPDC050417]|uniref:ABC transporter permease n=1 Tax=Micromonospora sp. NPDC050417 TaxID=3364280 RepID=UPI0037937003